VGKTTAKTAKKPLKKTTAKTKASSKTTKKPAYGKKAKATNKSVYPSKTLAKIDPVQIDFCGVELNDRQIKFLINFIIPGQPCFHNAYKSAIEAGYAETVARVDIHGFVHRSEIKQIIRRNEYLLHDMVHNSAMRAVQIKQERAFFDPLDYFDIAEETLYTKQGDPYMKRSLKLKELADMTLEQRQCIDGMDSKGTGNVPVYMMANRGDELNDLIKLDKEYEKAAANKEDDEDESIEVIMERLTVKKTVRQVKDETSRAAGLVRLPKSAVTEL